MRFIPIISLSILILLLTACSADTGSSVNASANLSQDQPHQDIPALPLTDSGLSLLVRDYTYTPKPQADPGVCLKIAFRQLCVPLCGRFGPDEGGVAGYVDRIGTKYAAKWGVQTAGMNFQTGSRAEDRKVPEHEIKDKDYRFFFHHHTGASAVYRCGVLGFQPVSAQGHRKAVWN